MGYDRMRVFIDPLGEYLDGYRQAEQDEIKAQLAYREARAADQEFDFREAADPLKLRSLEAELDGMLLSNQQRQRDYDLGYGLRHDPYAAALSSARAAATRRAATRRASSGGGRYTTRAAPGQAAPAVGGNNAVGPDGVPLQPTLPTNSPEALRHVSEAMLSNALADPSLPPDARAAIQAELDGRGGATSPFAAPVPVKTTALLPSGHAPDPLPAPAPGYGQTVHYGPGGGGTRTIGLDPAPRTQLPTTRQAPDFYQTLPAPTGQITAQQRDELESYLDGLGPAPARPVDPAIARGSAEIEAYLRSIGATSLGGPM